MSASSSKCSRLALCRPEVGNDPAYCANEAVDGETDYRDLHKRDQRPNSHTLSFFRAVPKLPS